MRSVAESPVSMETWFMSVSCAGSAVSAPCLLIKSRSGGAAEQPPSPHFGSGAADACGSCCLSACCCSPGVPGTRAVRYDDPLCGPRGRGLLPYGCGHGCGRTISRPAGVLHHGPVYFYAILFYVYVSDHGAAIVNTVEKKRLRGFTVPGSVLRQIHLDFHGLKRNMPKRDSLPFSIRHTQFKPANPKVLNKEKTF